MSIFTKMAGYSFQETLQFFAEKLHQQPPEEDLEKKEVELAIDQQHIEISEGKNEGTLHMKIVLGILVQPVRESTLKDLATSNFLGINTGGCTLSLDETGTSLYLHCHVTCPTTPQENWEWMHRILSISQEWSKILTQWDEFIPLSAPIKEKQDESDSSRHSFKA